MCAISPRFTKCKFTYFSVSEHHQEDEGNTLFVYKYFIILLFALFHDFCILPTFINVNHE